MICCMVIMATGTQHTLLFYGTFFTVVALGYISVFGHVVMVT